MAALFWERRAGQQPDLTTAVSLAGLPPSRRGRLEAHVSPRRVDRLLESFHTARHARGRNLAPSRGARDSDRLRLGQVRTRLPVARGGLDRERQDRSLGPRPYVRRAGADRLRQRRSHLALVLRPARLHRRDEQGPQRALRGGRRREVVLVHLELSRRSPPPRRSAASQVTLNRTRRPPCPTSPCSGTP